MIIIIVCLFFLPDLDALSSPPQALTPLSARSSSNHPLVVSGPLVLWCSTDAQIRRAFFMKAGSSETKKEGIVQGTNATFVIETPTILDAGDYSCELEATTGRKRENLYVYVRPIFHSTVSERLEPQNGDEFVLEAPAVTATRGNQVLIACPVFGHPVPKIKWTKDRQTIDESKDVSIIGKDLKINSADFGNEGIYSCEAINEFTAGGKTSRPLLAVQRKLHVKSELAWVYPLVVIIAILVILLTTIFFCEIRKKRHEKLLTSADTDE